MEAAGSLRPVDRSVTFVHWLDASLTSAGRRTGVVEDGRATGLLAGGRGRGHAFLTALACAVGLGALAVFAASASGHSLEISGSMEGAIKVEVEPKASFSIEQLQRLAGEASFTPVEVSAKLGQVVQYEIIVKNTSNIPLTFSTFTDAACQSILGGPGAYPVPPGASTIYTCEHTLMTMGSYANEATVEGSEEAGKKTSNKVVVNVTAEPAKQEPLAEQTVAAACSVSEGAIQLRGASGAKRTPFKVTISSLGIKEITFFVDGRKLKRFTAAQAVKGQFAVTIDPRKYHYGAHKVSVKTVMGSAGCANIARSGVFLRARPATIKPKFTG